MPINKLRVRRYINNIDIIENDINSFESIKLTPNKNETFDTAEIVYISNVIPDFKLIDRVKVEKDFFTWYVYKINTKIFDVHEKLYRIQVILIELTEKLKNYPMANLSFNQFLQAKQFANLFEIIDRARLLTPLEKSVDIDNTRTTFGTGLETDPIWKQKGYTERLYNLLIAMTDVKEFQATGRNLYEFYLEPFYIIGGAPKVIATDWSDSVLDVELFDEEVGEVNIDNYFYYEENQDATSYASNAEINTNNIVSNDADYESGLVTGKVMQSEDFIIDPDISKNELEVPIYRMTKAQVSKIVENNYTDLTINIKNEEEFKILDIDRGGPTKETTQNCIQYVSGSRELTGWGKLAKKRIIVQDTHTWINMFEDRGIDTSGTEITDYKFKFTYEVMNINNRSSVESLDLTENNKNASIRINTGERINEYQKVISITQNKLSRLGAKTITKVVKHEDIDDVYPNGTYDLDTGFKIVAQEITITKGDTIATYVLTKDLNVLNPNVGVNTKNRFTDTKVGGGLIRAEIYKDYLIFTTDTVANIPNTSSITDKGFALFFSVLGISPDFESPKHGHFLISGNDGAISPTIIPSDVRAGNRIISIKAPISRQTFVDNEITPTVVSGQNRLIERGVRYTDQLGLLDTLSFRYGNPVTTSIDESTIRALPNAQGLIDTSGEPIDGVYTWRGVYDTFGDLPTATENDYAGVGTEFVRNNNQAYLFVGGLWEDQLQTVGEFETDNNIETESTSFIEVGNINISKSTNKSLLTGKTVTKSISPSFGTDTVTLNKVYTINDESVRSFDFGWSCDFSKAEFANGSPINAKIVITGTTDFGGTIPALSVTYNSIRVGEGLDSRIYIPEFDEKVGNNFNHLTDFLTADFDNVVLSEIIVDITYNVNTPTPLLSTARTATIVLSDVSVTTTTFVTEADKDGLFIDKNFNEIIPFEYLMHCYSRNEEIIIGDAMTTKNGFVYFKDIFQDYLIYTSDERYSKYDTTIIKGQLDNNLSLSNPSLSTDGIVIVDLNGNLPDNKHYAVVGLFQTGEQHLLYAINVKRGGTQAKKRLSIYRRHFNDAKVYRY